METLRKHSKQREAILNTIRSTNAHPSAEWVYSKLKPQYPKLSLATVYRNIALFKEQGDIISVGTVHGQERYDGKTTEHAHVICTQCGCIVDLHTDLHIQTAEILSLCPEEFIISGCELTFYGLCPDCRKEA